MVVASNTSIENMLVEKATASTPLFKRIGILWALCFCQMSDIVEMVSIGFILASMSNISILEKSLAGASIYFGIMAGDILWGPLADVIGRKSLLQGCLLVSGLSAFASAFTPTISLLIMCRVFAGFGIGGVVPTLFSLGAELFSAERRGPWLAIICSMKEVASIYASVLAWLVLGKDLQGHRISPNLDWRAYAMLCVIPAFVAFLLSFFLVESPLLLIEKKRIRGCCQITHISS